MKLITIIIIVAIVNLLQTLLNKPKGNRANRRALHKKNNKKVKDTKDIGEYIEVDEMIKPYIDRVEEDTIEEISEVVEAKIDRVKVEEPKKIQVELSNTDREKHKSRLNIKKKNIAQGIIWNEILNKPKSLRK